MSDPTRWNADASDAPAELRELFDARHAPAPMTKAERAKVMSIAAGIASASSVAGASTGVGIFSASALAKGVGVVAVLLATGVSARAVYRARAPRPTPVSQPAPGARSEVTAERVVVRPSALDEARASATAPIVPAATVTPVVETPPRAEAVPSARRAPLTGRFVQQRSARAVAPASPVATARPSALAPSPDVASAAPSSAPVVRDVCPVTVDDAGLGSQARVLSAASRALAAHPEVTAACVALLTERGPSPALDEERTYLGFEAARRRGRDAEAQRWARALLDRAPASGYAMRARAWLEAHASTPPDR